MVSEQGNHFKKKRKEKKKWFVDLWNFFSGNSFFFSFLYYSCDPGPIKYAMKSAMQFGCVAILWFRFDVVNGLNFQWSATAACGAGKSRRKLNRGRRWFIGRCLLNDRSARRFASNRRGSLEEGFFDWRVTSNGMCRDWSDRSGADSLREVISGAGLFCCLWMAGVDGSLGSENKWIDRNIVTGTTGVCNQRW